MKTNGILKIETRDNQEVEIIFEPENGTLWLSKSELPELFGVTISVINACINTVFKKRLFREEDVCEFDLYTSGNTIKYDKKVFRLDVIVAMAFQINSPNAQFLRQWLIERCLKCRNLDLTDIVVNQNYSLN